VTGPRADVEEAVMRALRAADEPVREAVLYERVRARVPGLDADLMLAVLERLATEDHVHLAVEHDLPAHDPPPFQPRFWRVTG
jgi:hypothetical protein